MLIFASPPLVLRVPWYCSRVPVTGDWWTGPVVAYRGPPHERYEHETGPCAQNLCEDQRSQRTLGLSFHNQYRGLILSHSIWESASSKVPWLQCVAILQILWIFMGTFLYLKVSWWTYLWFHSIQSDCKVKFCIKSITKFWSCVLDL